MNPSLPPPLPRAKSTADDAGMRFLLPIGRSLWAIAAGYLGLFSLIIIPAPLALIVSGVAIWDIRRSRKAPQPKYGMGRAIFGLVMGLLGTAALAAVIFEMVAK